MRIAPSQPAQPARPDQLSRPLGRDGFGATATVPRTNPFGFRAPNRDPLTGIFAASSFGQAEQPTTGADRGASKVYTVATPGLANPFNQRTDQRPIVTPSVATSTRADITAQPVKQQQRQYKGEQ